MPWPTEKRPFFELIPPTNPDMHNPGAEAGTLTFMCGGDQGSVARAEEAVLRHMGQKVVHCGGAGTGGIAKICNNLVLGVNMAGVAEAMNLGVRLGACFLVCGSGCTTRATSTVP